MVSPLDALVPAHPAADAPLHRALVADARARLARARRAWTRSGLAPPRGRVSGLEAGTGPFRCWLAGVEDALAIASAAARLSRTPRVARRRSPGLSRLVRLVADEGILARLAPGGRIPDDFPERALREARARLAARARGLGRALRDARDAALADAPSVGPLLVERGLRTVGGERDRRFERRVVAALALLERAWPAGSAMVRTRCWRVVPVAAWGTVSWSSARAPGIAYVDARSAPAVRLAEDLVHEATHMRIHAIEAVRDLVSPAAREAGGAEPRFYSPWRREWRPLRGILHAACTFTVGEAFFERMLALGEFPPARRRWLARRLLEERESVRCVLPVLRVAARRGLLTAAGRRIAGAVARAHRGTAASARREARSLAATAEGRRDLARVARLAAVLARRPVRW